ncbi:MAG: hypothetical protein KDE27_23455 [Planctomycetes bacterium]|nr:hypothetical protein [Planctomycetota bacterium]
MPGCSAWLAPVYTRPPVNMQGTATFDIAIPMSQYFVGIDFYVQAAVLVPGWNLASVVVSNAGHGRAGTP